MRSSRAFTLVEVLVAGGVMLLVLVIAGGALWTGGKSSTRGIEKLDEISRLARLGEYLKKSLRFATQVHQDQPEPGTLELKVRFVEEVTPATGSRTEKDARFLVTPTPDGKKKVAIDIAGRTQSMEFDVLDVRVGVAGNLITVVLDGGKGRVLEVSVASPFMVALSGIAGNPLESLGASPEGGSPPAATPGPSAGPAAPPASGPPAFGLPQGEVASTTGTGPAPSFGALGTPTPPVSGPATGATVASLPPGPGRKPTRSPAGESGIKGLEEGQGPRPADQLPPPLNARSLPDAPSRPERGPREPDVVTVDDTGTVLSAPPTGPTRGPGTLKPTLQRTPEITPPPPVAADTRPEDAPREPSGAGTTKRRLRRPLSPKDVEALEQARSVDKEPDEEPDKERKPNRARPPRASQTVDTQPRGDAGVDSPF
ncbi:MAG: hypothetical protein HY816_18595 [Candidatus Wallbacteria bacterium]|nr:hypothetical protein [Candidatus Wallbacteria bacterium]